MKISQDSGESPKIRKEVHFSMESGGSTPKIYLQEPLGRKPCDSEYDKISGAAWMVLISLIAIILLAIFSLFTSEPVNGNKSQKETISNNQQ